MKLRLLDFLVCPIDRGPLELVVWEKSSAVLCNTEIRQAKRQGIDPSSLCTEIVTGVLLNNRRKTFYPIFRGVPRMLVFPTAVACEFVARNKQRISRELPGFMLPSEEPMPGEQTVLRTFSSEWVNYDWNGESYWNYKPEIIYKGMDFMLDFVHSPPNDKLVLEVGIGIGGIADHVARAHECELFGIDLSYAVDSAYHHFGKNRFLHVVQASAFAPPFKESTFDLVYSQGVLHHTFSTRTAFERISRLAKTGGRLYVWVYSMRSEKRNLVRRGIMLMERMLRPLCWRLPEHLQGAVLVPIIPLYLLHQNFHSGRNPFGCIKYGWREAMHAARDRFTPRYAYRHSEEEVCSWFHEAGYDQTRCVSERVCPEYVPTSFIDATAVDGVRC